MESRAQQWIIRLRKIVFIRTMWCEKVSELTFSWSYPDWIQRDKGSVPTGRKLFEIKLYDLRTEVQWSEKPQGSRKNCEPEIIHIGYDYFTVGHPPIHFILINKRDSMY